MCKSSFYCTVSVFIGPYSVQIYNKQTTGANGSIRFLIKMFNNGLSFRTLRIAKKNEKSATLYILLATTHLSLFNNIISDKLL